MQEKKAVDLGALIDLSEQLKQDPKKTVPGKKPKIKVYPMPTGGKGPMGRSEEYYETTKEREEATKG